MMKSPYNLGLLDGINSRENQNPHDPRERPFFHYQYNLGYDQGVRDNDAMERSEEVF